MKEKRSAVTFVAEADGTEVADGKFRVVFGSDNTFTTSDPDVIAFLQRHGFRPAGSAAPAPRKSIPVSVWRAPPGAQVSSVRGGPSIGQAAAVIQEIDGRYVVTELRITPSGRKGLRQVDLRKLSLSAALDDAKWKRETKSAGLALHRDAVRRMTASAEDRRRGKPKDSMLLAIVAEEYLSACDFTGHPYKLLRKAVEEKFEERFGSTQKLDADLHELVRSARRNGWLGPAPRPGAAGGTETEKLRKWQQAKKRNARRRKS